MKKNSHKLQRHYNRISAFYDLLDWPFEHFRYRKLRPGLCAGLQGDILEAGVGTGHNLAYYDAQCRIHGIDLSASQLLRAKIKADKAACSVTLSEMDATQMSFDDNQFDACLSTFMFCVLPNPLQLPALKEIIRVVKPGGIIRLLEYRYAKQPVKKFWMKLTAPLTEAVFQARFDRETMQAVDAMGDKIDVLKTDFLVDDILLLIELKVK